VNKSDTVTVAAAAANDQFNCDHLVLVLLSKIE
jgi:hypothetical protein